VGGHAAPAPHLHLRVAEPASLTWDQVRAWRVARQHLDKRVAAKRMTDVVSGLLGVHAQVQSSAEIALWARVNGISRDDVRDALWERRSLVKSWFMRGTLHLLTAEDAPLYVGGLRTQDRWWKRVWLDYVGLTEPQLKELMETIRQVLSDKPLTREQLSHRVARKIGDHARERMGSGWGELLKPASFHGYLCSGPPRGQSVTFVRPDKWLGRWKEIDGDQAMRELFRRYLTTYGPASHQEFATWWGVQPPPARRLRMEMEDQLQEVDLEGRQVWALPADVAKMRRATTKPTVRLLPGFDPYVVGFRPREGFLDKRFTDRVYRKAAWISPVVLVDGRAAGVWKPEKKGARLEVSVQPFARLSPAHRKAVAQEADRLGKFLDAPVTVTYG
jgi:uncharacterized protein YcaQ